MAGRQPVRRRAILALAACGALWAAAPAQGATVWRIQPAPPGGLDARVGLMAGVTTGAYPLLQRNLTTSPASVSQRWTLTRRGGTIPQPWYEVTNLQSKTCLSSDGGTEPTPAGIVEVGMTTCPFPRLTWWQFRTLTDQPGNPGLSTANPGLWRIHWYGQERGPASGAPGSLCLTVPYAQLRAGTRLGLQRCSQSANQQWWVYRSTFP